MRAATASKVEASHLARNAYLYVRQSTLRQVLNNTESTARQYALRPPTARASNISWLRTAWAGRRSCSASRCPAWPAITPTGTACWRFARWQAR